MINTSEDGAQAMIRVLVADDQDIVRAGLTMLLDAQPGIEVIGEAADGREAVTNALRHARHATEVHVTVDGEGREVLLIISDDGTSGSGGRAASPGSGLVGMTERAGLLGGALRAGPAAAGGWQVEAMLPRDGVIA
jgi:nitrate/nitrite-specific signal transduction histidine kinase